MNFGNAIIIVICICFSSAGYSATKTASTGDWATSGTWSPSGVPVTGDLILIPDGVTLTVSTNLYNPSPANLNIVIGDDDGDGSGGILSFTVGKLNLTLTSVITVTANSSMQSTTGAGGDRVSFGTGAATVNYTGTQLNFTGPGLFSSAGGVLPIELAYLNTKKLENGTEIKWQTFSETNNDYFTIEYSLDFDNWIILGYVQGQGNSKKLTDYSFIHTSEKEDLVYYRIEQTDFDGTFSYSPIVSSNGSLENSISIFPIPFSNFIIVSNIEDVKFKIVNIDGDEVFCNAKLENRSKQVYVETALLNPGVYFFVSESKKVKIFKE